MAKKRAFQKPLTGREDLVRAGSFSEHVPYAKRLVDME
jgi:hypothetical protein